MASPENQLLLPPLLLLLLEHPTIRRSTVFKCLGLKERGAVANTCRGLSELVQRCKGGSRSSSGESEGDGLLDVWSSLDFTGCRDAGVTFRAALQRPVVAGNMRHLSFEFCREIVDRDLVVLEAARLSLVSLNLNALHNISGEGVLAAARGNSATLRHLSLYWLHALPSASVAEVAKACPRLEVLNLSGCQKTEDSAVRALARNCRGLTDLDLTRCPLLSGAALHFLAPRLTHLRRLNLYANAQIAPDASPGSGGSGEAAPQLQPNGSGGSPKPVETSGYAALAQLSQLEFLDMCGASKAPPGDIAAIAAGCPNLATWNLSWCVRVTDDAVAAIARHCRKMESLSLFGIINLTDVAVDELAKPGRCGRVLREIDVHGCCNIRRQKFDDLREIFPKLSCFKLHS